ncbi:hypothetical protein R6Q57_014572 [Mikania cordata]
MPTVNPIWKRYRNDAASDWEFVYHDRLQEYQSWIDQNKSQNSLVLANTPLLGSSNIRYQLTLYCYGCRDSTSGRCRPSGAADGPRYTRLIAARVAAVRAWFSGGDEVPTHYTDEHGDASMYRLGSSWRLRGGGACASPPWRGHPGSPGGGQGGGGRGASPDIEFSLGGQHFEMSIERFAVHLGLYYEPETVLDDFG